MSKHYVCRACSNECTFITNRDQEPTDCPIGAYQLAAWFREDLEEYVRDIEDE